MAPSLLKFLATPLFITLAVVPYRSMGTSGRARPRGTSRFLRNVAVVASHWYCVSDLTGLGIEPQTFRIDSHIFNNCALTGWFVEKLLIDK